MEKTWNDCRPNPTNMRPLYTDSCTANKLICIKHQRQQIQLYDVQISVDLFSLGPEQTIHLSPDERRKTNNILRKRCHVNRIFSTTYLPIKGTISFNSSNTSDLIVNKTSVLINIKHIHTICKM